MKHTLFTTLLAMVFNIAFLLQWSSACHNKRRKLHGFGGAKGHWGSNLGPPASEGRPSPIELCMQLPSGPLLVPSPV